jgi:hypothetical protein
MRRGPAVESVLVPSYKHDRSYDKILKELLMELIRTPEKTCNSKLERRKPNEKLSQAAEVKSYKGQ